MVVALGIKTEMTQIFDENGQIIPVTIIDLNNTYFVGKRTLEKDKYESVMIGIGNKKKTTKSEKVKYGSINKVPKKVREFRENADMDVEIGSEIDITKFEVGKKVNVTGITKGKGFEGGVKRWGFAGGPKTHGQSDRHRAPGSIGAGTDPGRVFKGIKMAGHRGNIQKTVENLKIIKVDEKNRFLLVKGAVPGPKGSLLKITQK